MEEHKTKSAEQCGCHNTYTEHEHDHICGCCDCDKEHDEEVTLPRLVTAGILFVLGIIFSKLHGIVLFLNSRSLLDIAAAESDFFVIAGAALAITMFLLSYLICGLGVLKNAVWNLLHGKFFDEQFLMAVASIGAVLIGEYPEAVAVMLFYQIGEFFQDYALGKSEKSIAALMEARPDSATVVRNGKECAVHPDDVEVGETVVVAPGQKIPLDGIIIEGNSFADTSALTGESVPREIVPGCEVLGGFVNTEGVLKIRVTKPFAESSIARILELVEHSAEKKSRAEQFITRFARVYTPLVIFAALAVAVLPPLLTGIAGGGFCFETWVRRALVFLVVSCPCALVISVPMGFVGGIGACAKKGILVKGASYVEALAKTRIAAFDKTGTLTRGVFVVTDIHCAANGAFSRDELLALATHAEYYSKHPISDSLKTAHSCERCALLLPEQTTEISGQGIKTVLDGKNVLVGNEKLMQSFAVQGFARCAEDGAGTVVHVAADGVYCGHIVIADEIKADSKAALSELKRLGIARTVLLTGDTASAAQELAAALGIDSVYSDLLPADKVQKVEELLAHTNGGTLLYAGDGINDAPVLARADVGVAMGALGSDAAIEAADVVIMTDEPSRLADGIRIARRTMLAVRQNIVFALGVKFLAMLLGTLGVTGMWFAVFADVGVTFLAVLNSLRLLVTSRA